MEVPIPLGGQKTEWQRIRAIDVQAYDGPVHSMAVDRYGHYLADGMVTHNCFYCWKEGAAHRFYGPNNVPDVWSVKKVNPQSMIHLTEKPVELASRAMTYSSRCGENVLDLFGGSGSTLIAAEQTGRKAFLMELDAYRKTMAGEPLTDKVRGFISTWCPLRIFTWPRSMPINGRCGSISGSRRRWTSRAR